MELKNKTILITGGSSGIGQALVKLLQKKGGEVISFDIKEPTARVDGVKYIKADISKSGQIKKALAKISQPIDVLINNAGIIRRGTLLETTEDEFNALFNVLVKGVWLMLKHTKSKLINTATILQISSRHGMSLPPDPGVYALCKNIIIDFSDMLQRTYPHYTVKIACPGPVNTPLSRYDCTKEEFEQKKRMLISPEDMAEKIIKLLESDHKKLVFQEEENNYEFS